MDPKTLLLIAMGMCGGFIEPTRPGICSAEGDPPAGGGGGGDPPKFSQADVEKLIGERLGRASKDHAKATADAVTAAVTKANEEHAAKMAELEAKIADAGKSEAEKAKAAAERDAKATLTRLENESKGRLAAEAKQKELEASIAAERLGRRTDAFRTQLLTELGAAKTPQAMLADAVDIALMRSKVTFDDDGKVSVEGFGGTYTDAKSMAAAFLKATPSFASHPGGGNGTKHTGVGLPGGSTLDALVAAGDANALLRSGGARLLTPSSVAVDQAEKDALAPGR